MKLQSSSLALTHAIFTLGAALLILSIFPQKSTVGWLAISIGCMIAVFFWRSPLPAAHTLGAKRMFVWFSLVLACIAFGTLYVPSPVRIISISLICPLLLISASLFLQTQPARHQATNYTLLIGWAIALGLSFPIAEYFTASILLGVSAGLLILSTLLAVLFVPSDRSNRIAILPQSNLRELSLRDIRLPVLLRIGAVAVALFMCLAFSVRSAALGLVLAPIVGIFLVRAIKTLSAPLLATAIGATVAVGSQGIIQAIGAFVCISFGVVSFVILFYRLKDELTSKVQKNHQALFGVSVFSAAVVASIALAIIYSITNQVSLFAMGATALTVLAARH